jgi:stress response protein YsnF
VRETPIHEQVNLREEHVSVERRPVSGEAGRQGISDAAFQERNIEMTETSEVPVVDKEARVTEEMVIKKTADQRTENVEDTVRRTEVEVDEDRNRGDRSAMGFGRDGDKR